MLPQRRCPRCNRWFRGIPARKYCHAKCVAVPVDQQGGVYFIHSPQGFVKIGMSADITSRLASLQYVHPLPLTLLGIMPLTWRMHRPTERLLHEKFKDLRQHGEWFKLERS